MGTDNTGQKIVMNRIFCLACLFIHWNPSIVDFFVAAKSSTIEGFSTNEGFLCSEKFFSKA